MIAPAYLSPTAQDAVRVYPNPARVSYGQNKLYFCNIEPGGGVKIFNISGELIEELMDSDKIKMEELSGILQTDLPQGSISISQERIEER